MFLFYIITEGLSELMQRASDMNLFKGIKLGNEDYLTHLQYADDTLILSPLDMDSLANSKWILR